MSVTELPERRDDQSTATGYDRTPPQDVAAEQSVLGGMLLSKDAIADVVEVLRGHDMYRPAHETIFEAILDLYGRGEPADPLTVADELKKRGELGRIGGAPYLHTLVSSVPTAANAGYYAEIVRERAVLRRLVEAGMRIVQMGYGGDGDADDIVDRAQAEVYGVTDRRTSDDYLPLGDIMEGTLDEIEAIGSRGGQMVGVPTGFADLDALTNGLHPGQLIVVAARPAIGKALALDTPLPTPTGWTTMGDVQVGDELIGADGRPTRVVATTDAMLNRPCYEVEFSDGSVIVADAMHQWVTTTRAARRAASERVPARHYWTLDAVARARAAASRALVEADRLVTSTEAVAEAGPEFRHVIHAVARQSRPVRRQVRVAAGAKRSYEWHAPVYSRQQLLADLAVRVARPVNEWHAAHHSQVVTTEVMAATLRCSSADGRLNHAVRLARPFELPEADLPLPPYALGVWLGDGDSSGAAFTSFDPEIATNVRAEGVDVVEYRPHRFRMRVRQHDPPERQCIVCGTPFVPATSQVRTCGRSCGGRAKVVSAPAPKPTCPDCGAQSSGLRRCQACHRHHGTVNAILRSMGVLGSKHIPEAYLRASERQRRSLLAGLLDTDGSISKTGCVQFDVTSRRLAEGALELILSLGYRARIRTREVAGRSEETSTCYRIAFTPGDPVFRLRRKLHRQRFEHAPTGRMVVDVRRIRPVPVRCVEVDNVEHLYLAGRSCIPTHNSTLGLDISRTAAIRHQLTTVMFSLEMSRNEITMRLLSAEGRVPLHHMRSGQMTDDDWNRIARRTGEVSSAPLFIDDSPNMTMMEIRAKCRRLKQRHDLRLVVIDYLQLMTSGKKVESRQQEVAEFSRALKLLAKELDLPVVAISQLNRSAEQRQDKKPMLADLRESGCVTAATRVLRADTGAEVPIGELLATGERDIPVWALDESLRYVPRTLTHAFPTGRRPVFRVRLASGRAVEATANHRFLTYGGWRLLADLAVGGRVAVTRHVPAPMSTTAWPAEQVIAWARLVGDGSAVPGELFSLPNEQIALFLRHLWAGWRRSTADGAVDGGPLSLVSARHGLVRDVSSLLQRFGISARVRPTAGDASSRRLFTVEIVGRDEQVRFLRQVGCRGAHDRQCAELLALLTSSTPGPTIDTIPVEVWARVHAVLAEPDTPAHRLVVSATSGRRHGSGPSGDPSTRQRLGRVAALLDDADVEIHATNDVLWDPITSIEPIGEHDVYDATVMGVHNFVGNGVALHNSIEQDADMVILLHREDAYEKESPRAGEADFIVAKHRNGPTATITVAFQGHYSRFVDMAQ